MPALQQLDRLAQSMTPSASLGRVYMVVPVSAGAGASSMCAQLAKFSVQHSARPAWIFDLNFRQNVQAKRAPLNGHIISAELDGDRFWSVEPAQSARMAMRRVEGLPIYISQFQYSPGKVKRVSLRRQSGYWNKVRAVSALTLVDVPFGHKSARSLYGDMDGVVLVVDAHKTQREAAEKLAETIEAAGGRVMGVVVNRAQAM
jgi:Mrp family chromosome partitioning ATPase